jgi:hypothetical protein
VRRRVRRPRGFSGGCSKKGTDISVAAVIAKTETRNSKSETNSKFEYEKVPTPSIHNDKSPIKVPLTPALSPSPIGSGQADGEREKSAIRSVVMYNSRFRFRAVVAQTKASARSSAMWRARTGARWSIW